MYERPHRADHLEIRTIGSEVFVNDPAKGQIHVFNLTAGMVLEGCDGTATIDDIVATIVAASGVESDLVRRDTVNIVEKFGELGMLGSVPVAKPEAADRGDA